VNYLFGSCRGGIKEEEEEVKKHLKMELICFGQINVIKNKYKNRVKSDWSRDRGLDI
jgi:hypothetical protein